MKKYTIDDVKEDVLAVIVNSQEDCDLYSRLFEVAHPILFEELSYGMDDSQFCLMYNYDAKIHFGSETHYANIGFTIIDMSQIKELGEKDMKDNILEVEVEIKKAIKFSDILKQTEEKEKDKVVRIKLHTIEQYVELRNKLENIGYFTDVSIPAETRDFVEYYCTSMYISVDDKAFFLSSLDEDYDYNDIDFEEDTLETWLDESKAPISVDMSNLSLGEMSITIPNEECPTSVEGSFTMKMEDFCEAVRDSFVSGLSNPNHHFKRDVGTFMEQEEDNNPFAYMFADCNNSHLNNKDYKDITGKLPLQLVDPIALSTLGKVLQYGIEKYGEENKCSYQNGEIDTYIGAMLRHLVKYQEGELQDPESNLEHLEHMFFNAYAIIYLNCKKKSIEKER